MIEWLSVGLAAVACIAVVGWLKSNREARDWAMVCHVLGDEYDKLVLELAQKGQPKMNVVEQRTRWIN